MNVGGIPEAVIDNENGFLTTPGNVNELVEKILMLVNNNELLVKFGNYSRKRAVSMFSSEKQADSYIQLYKNALLSPNEQH
jgi:glycosyltransferase involved in cell wall biosynthesis